MTMDIIHKARRLEASLARSVDDAARRLAKRGTREPLEIANAIVDAICARIEPVGRGTVLFPYNSIRVCVAASTPERRVRTEAVFAGNPPLEERIRAELARAGAAPTRLAVTWAFVEAAMSDWADPDFGVEFDRVELSDPTTTPAVAGPDRLSLTVLAGHASKTTYVFTAPRINVGRCVEVRDAHHRLVRTNHVAFVDADENSTVSRHHAHIECVAHPPAYRLCDDGSVHGTAIVRDGRTILVPAGARGVRLQSGDEIALGDARLRVKIG